MAGCQELMAAAQVKLEGKENDLIKRIAADEKFGLTEEEINSLLLPEKYIGRSVHQTEEFIRDVAQPIIDKYFVGGENSDLKV